MLLRLALAALAALAAAAAPPPAGSDRDRIAWLKSKSPSGAQLVRLTGADLRALVEGAPRSYHLIVALGSPDCEPCTELTRSLAATAKEFPTLTKRPEAPVFFATSVLSQADRDFIAAYQLKFVPVLYHFAPNKKFPSDLHAKTDPAVANIQNAPGGVSQSVVKRFVNVRLGSNFKVRRTGAILFKPFLFQALPVALIAVIFFVGVAVRLRWYSRHMFWFGVMSLVYAFGTSGAYFVFLHDSPLLVFSENGPVYVASGARDMYAAEGILAATCYLSIAGALILAPSLPSAFEKKTHRSVASAALLVLLPFLGSRLYNMFLIKYPYHLAYQ